MKFKIQFNETAHFKQARLKEQFLSHSKEKIEKLFNEVFYVKDYKGQPDITIYRAKGLKDYLITELFGSGQTRFFKIKKLEKK